jgi:hypothetical protein
MAGTQKFGTGISAEFAPGGGGTDPLAWHNTLDAFGAVKQIGTSDNFAMPFSTNNVERFRITAAGDFFFALNTTIAGLEFGVRGKYQFTCDDTQNASFIFSNPNAGVTAYATIDCINNSGLGASLIAIGDGWDGSVQANLLPGDAGLAYQTLKGIDATGDAGLVIINGVGPIKFFTAYPNVERMRITTLGNLRLEKNLHLGDPISADIPIGVKRAFAGAVNGVFYNTQDGGAATAGVAGVNSAGNVAELFITAPSYTPALGWEAGSSILDQDVPLVVVTRGANGMKFKTNGDNTRYKIDSDGKMAWFGAATVAQQTVGAVTNSVTAGGADGTIADYTDLTVYATDAAAIRNDIYQLARSVAQLATMVRNYGLAA